MLNYLDNIRNDILKMKAYKVNDYESLLKMDSMENPFNLPENLQTELANKLVNLEINRYPNNKRLNYLKNLILEDINLINQKNGNYDILLGNGSDEIISLLTLLVAKENAKILVPSPSFIMYEISSKLNKVIFIKVDLTKDFELDLLKMIEAIKINKPNLIFLAYPNNPTANLWNKDNLKAIIQEATKINSLIIIDEAYNPFTNGKTWLNKLDNNPNILIMRTLSKFGLAGIRLGYLIGKKEIINEIEKIKSPYNISVLNYETAIFALENKNVFEHQAKIICKERDDLIIELKKVKKIKKVYVSQANMILIKVQNADKTFELMKNNGVLIKNVSNMHKNLNNCLRLTVGKPEENIKMLDTLKKSL